MHFSDFTKKILLFFVSLFSCLSLCLNSVSVPVFAKEAETGHLDAEGNGKVTLNGISLRIHAEPGWFKNAGFSVRSSVTGNIVKAAHGELHDAIGYEICLYDALGEEIQTGYAYSVTVGYGLSEEDRVYHSNEAGLMVEEETVQKTETEFTVSLCAKGTQKILAGKWDYTRDTFLSTGGRYSIGYILAHYNVFVEEQYTGTHVVGPVIVGGTASASLGGVTTGTPYVHDVPSYVQSMNGSNRQIITGSRVPAYVGTNMGEFRLVEDLSQNKTYDDYYYTDEFIDWSKAMQAVSVEAKSYSGESVSVSGSTLQLPLKGRRIFEMSSDQLNHLSEIDFEGDFKAGDDTFIFVRGGGEMHIPKTLNNGKEIDSIESGMEGSLVYLLPDASKVTGTAVSGHIVAPEAEVKIDGGYFNGCVIARKLRADAEMHMWPYNGQLLEQFSLQATKMVDDQVPTESQVFSFTLYEWNGSSWIEKETRQNEGSRISFSMVSYTQAGKQYWYKIAETGCNEDYILDTIQYAVRVDTVSRGETTEAQYTYYRLQNSDSLPEEKDRIPVDEKILSRDVLQFHNRTKQKAQIQLSVQKEWQDEDNQDGKRPPEVTVHLLSDGQDTGKTLHLSLENDWKGQFTELEEGPVYSVWEEAAADYQCEIHREGNTFTIINTHTPETMTLSGYKKWKDDHNVAGKRPESITIHLRSEEGIVKTLQLTGLKERDQWEYRFENLPKYKDGHPIQYSVEEIPVENYETRIEGMQIENTYKPGYTSVPVRKLWIDEENNDRLRPDFITVRLFRQTDTSEKTDTGRSLVLSEGNGWQGTFEDLPVKEGTETIHYSVEEDPVDSYTTEIEKEDGGGYILKNTHTPETVSIPVRKLWEDKDNALGLRPDSVFVSVLADGTAVCRHEIRGTGKEWTYTFTDLPKYKDGNPITYTLSEEEVPGYVSSVSQQERTITNTLSAEYRDIPVRKEWDDADNQDGLRPEKICVRLLENGKETDQSLILSSENNWSGHFEHLPLKDASQKEIVYTVQEETTEGYVSSVTGNAENGFVVVNSHMPETIHIQGKKTWKDEENLHQKRPSRIVIHLYADEEEVRSVTVSEEENWTYTFEDLPKYRKGNEIHYTVSEEPVENYVSRVSGYDIENTYVDIPLSIPVTKVWKDNDNRSGLRPEKITVYLVKDGKKTDQFLTLSAATDWKGVFENLLKEEQGRDIAYSIMEEEVESYTSTITGDSQKGYTLTNVLKEKRDISHTPGRTGRSLPVGFWCLGLILSVCGGIICLHLKKKR